MSCPDLPLNLFTRVIFIHLLEKAGLDLVDWSKLWQPSPPVKCFLIYFLVSGWLWQFGSLQTLWTIFYAETIPMSQTSYSTSLVQFVQYHKILILSEFLGVLAWPSPRLCLSGGRGQPFHHSRAPIFVRAPFFSCSHTTSFSEGSPKNKFKKNRFQLSAPSIR